MARARLLLSRAPTESRLTLASTLENACQRLAEESFDAVLLDLTLPGISGLDALTSVLPLCAPAPVIVLTGVGPGMASQALRRGAADYLEKGTLTADALERSLRYSIDRAAARRAYDAATWRSRRLVWRAPIGIFRADRRGVLLDVNPALEAIAGVATGEELLGRTLPIRMADGSGRPDLSRLEVLDAVNVVVERADGFEAACSLSAHLVPDDDRDDEMVWEGFLVDRSMQHAMENRIAEAERLRALGEFSAGVAHDLNNTLQIIRAASEILRPGLVETDYEPEYETLAEATERASRMVSKILTYCGRAGLDRVPLRPDELLRRMEPGLRVMVPEGVRFAVDVETDWSVVGDVSAIEQLVQNLVVNAFLSTQAGGVDVSLRPSPASGDGERDELLLEVRDTGCGIPESIRNTIFDPFMTTRGGEGTGLGLSVVKGVVEHHGGWIEVDSEVGVGTLFRVGLPRA